MADHFLMPRLTSRPDNFPYKSAEEFLKGERTYYTIGGNKYYSAQQIAKAMDTHRVTVNRWADDSTLEKKLGMTQIRHPLNRRRLFPETSIYALYENYVQPLLSASKSGKKSAKK